MRWDEDRKSSVRWDEDRKSSVRWDEDRKSSGGSSATIILLRANNL